MPTLNLGPQRRESDYQRTGQDKIIHLIYNTKQWKTLRDSYLMHNPLCEKCLKNGKTVTATEVHHITPISKGRNILEMKQLAYDSCNVMSLCCECHHQVHQEMKMK